MRIIRIFVSSPGDVDHERRRVEQVAQRLHGEFAHLVDIQTIRWETGFYQAHETFQAQIPEAANCDLVLAIFGTRLGSELPPNFPRRMADGEPYPSGTAYEVLTAIEARRTGKTPDVYVFRKTAKPVAAIDDPAELETARRQWERLKSFFEQWFRSAEGHFRAAFQTFGTTDEFGEQIEALLREWLDRNVLQGAHALVWPIELKGSPFRSLEPYEAKHASIFFGRKRDTARAIEKLTDAADRGCPFLLVIGPSGVGKSSFARAGLAPRLTTPGAVGSVDLWRVATMRPGGATPFLSLARALFGEPGEATALPEIGEGDSATAEELAATLRGVESAAVRPIVRALDRLAERERERGSFQREINASLLLIVDQLDELFGQGDAADRAGFARLLAALVATRKVWVIGTLRADLYEQFVAEPALVALKSAGAVYDLAALGLAELAETVREPAKAAGLIFDTDPQSGETLDERLIRDAGSGEALPLLQFTLQRLFEERVTEGDTVRLTIAAYDKIGGLDGAVDHAAETALRGLDADAVASLPLLLRQLTTLAHDPAAAGGSTLTIRPVDAAAVAQPPQLRRLVDALVEARILSVSQEGSAAVIRLAHQRVLRSWRRARDMVQADFEFFRIRDEVEDELRRWKASGQKPEYLLPKGVPLEEAEKIAARYRDELSNDTRNFIVLSGRRARRRQRLTEAAAVVFAAVGVAAVVLAVLAYRGEQRADRERLRAEQERSRAEGETVRADAALQRALLAQSRSLADLSQVFLLEGDAGTAVNLALEALSTDERGVARPYVREAEAALVAAVTGLKERAVLGGHTGPVRGAAISPDGLRIVTASADGTARLWSVRPTKEIATLKHEGQIDRAVFSPDGRLVATTSFDKSVRLWNAVTGQMVRILPHANGVTRLAFTRDGRRLVTGALDAAAHIFDIESGKEVLTLRVPSFWVSDLAISPDGRRIVTVTASFEQVARVWDAESGTQLFQLSGHRGSLNGVDFSPDGRSIMTFSHDNTARLWDAATGAELRVLRGHTGALFAAAFNAAGTRIVTGSADGTARIWNAETGQELAALTGHKAGVVHVAFSHDGRVIATASEDRTARLWDARNGQAVAVRRGHQAAVRFVAFTPDDRTLLTASDDMTARLWRADDQNAIRIVQDGVPAIWQARFSPDGRLVATATGNPGLFVWNVATGVQALHLSGRLISAAYSPDGRRIATGSIDGMIAVWDAVTGEKIQQIEAHKGPIWSIAFDAAGRSLATGSRDTTAALWDVASGRRLHALTGHPADVWSVAFSPDGKKLLTSGQEPVVRVWDTEQGAQISTLEGHSIAVRSVAFDRAGERIVTAGWDNTARIWDAATGKTLIELKGATAYLTEAVFTPDGKAVVASSYDRSLRGWDATSGDLRFSLAGHTDGMQGFGLSPDGRLATTVSLDGTALLWRLFPDTADGIAYAREQVPRCLTPDERRTRFLPQAPPDWCVAQGKWPYRPGDTR